MENKPALKIALENSERELVVKMLLQHSLPTTDIGSNTLLFTLVAGEKILGTAGLEIFGNCALLRSVSVMVQEHKKGYGSTLIREVESFAAGRGVSNLYLLTTTAAGFFSRLGYTDIKREEAPAPITQTKEFSSLCPSSATVMKKCI